MTLVAAGAMAQGIRVVQLRAAGATALARAADAAAGQQLGDARGALDRFLRDAGNHPGLADLRRQAEALLGSIEREDRATVDLARARIDLEHFLGLARLAELSDAQWLVAAEQFAGDPRPVRLAPEAALGTLGQIARDPAGTPDRWDRPSRSPASTRPSVARSTRPVATWSGSGSSRSVGPPRAKTLGRRPAGRSPSSIGSAASDAAAKAGLYLRSRLAG